MAKQKQVDEQPNDGEPNELDALKAAFAERETALGAEIEQLKGELASALTAGAKAAKGKVEEVAGELVEIVFHGRKGSEYHSTDPWGSKPGEPPAAISLAHGDKALVSPQKAAQIAADFPNDFKVGGKGPESGTKAFQPFRPVEDDED